MLEQLAHLRPREIGAPQQYARRLAACEPVAGGATAATVGAVGGGRRRRSSEAREEERSCLPMTMIATARPIT